MKKLSAILICKKYSARELKKEANDKIKRENIEYIETSLRRSEESLNDYESSLNDDHSEEERPQWPNVIVRPYMDVEVEEENLLHASTYPPAYRR